MKAFMDYSFESICHIHHQIGPWPIWRAEIHSLAMFGICWVQSGRHDMPSEKPRVEHPWTKSLAAHHTAWTDPWVELQIQFQIITKYSVPISVQFPIEKVQTLSVDGILEVTMSQGYWKDMYKSSGTLDHVRLLIFEFLNMFNPKRFLMEHA